MKLVSSFDSFMKEVVNLNDSRLKLLDDSFEAIKKFIRASDYKPHIVSFYPHGSWSHETIIRPIEGNAFDADVIIFLKPQDGWSAADYVNKLAAEFRASDVYKEKVRFFSHCVTIEYAGERKMDIAPCLVNRVSDDTFEVCHRFNDEFEQTRPLQYTAWVNAKNTLCGKNFLRKTTRLLKYLRDIKATFTCPSFLLTTLIGMQIREDDNSGPSFSDLPTALKTVIGRLDHWLQLRPSVPIVPNPVLATENQASGWNLGQYSNFRNQINRYRQWIDDAYEDPDAASSMQKWRKVFGEEFGEVKKYVATMESFKQPEKLDEVDQARRKGLLSLDDSILKPSWRRQPTWQLATLQVTVGVRARLTSFGSGRSMAIRSGTPVEPNQGIEFRSTLGGVVPGNDYRTHWRVTNTGDEARAKGELRGAFYQSDNPHRRSESLKYRGVHMVEAFIVRESDDRLVGFSRPFYVVVE